MLDTTSFEGGTLGNLELGDAPAQTSTCYNSIHARMARTPGRPTEPAKTQPPGNGFVPCSVDTRYANKVRARCCFVDST